MHEEAPYAHFLSMLQMEVSARCGWQQSQMLLEGELMQIIQTVWLIPFFHTHACIVVVNASIAAHLYIGLQEAYMAKDCSELDEKLEGAPEVMKVFLQQVNIFCF